MISTSEFKSGIALIIDNQLWQIVDYTHVKPGKGGAFVRTKLRRMKDGSIVEKTFRGNEKFQDAFIDKKTLEYLYRTDDELHMMDISSYEEVQIPASALGDDMGFLKENMELEGLFYEDELISIQLPMFIDVEVAETEPGVKGDSSKSGMKPAVIETGANVQVPLFVDKGERIRVDTRTRSYVSRL